MTPDIEAADRRLAAAFREAGCLLRAVTGVIDGTTISDRAGVDLFAWHRQPNHLLFYLRKPALKARSTLRQKAIGKHAEGHVRQNPGGETTITLTSDAEAAMLVGWLVPLLPFS